MKPFSDREVSAFPRLFAPLTPLRFCQLHGSGPVHRWTNRPDMDTCNTHIKIEVSLYCDKKYVGPEIRYLGGTLSGEFEEFWSIDSKSLYEVILAATCPLLLSRFLAPNAYDDLPMRKKSSGKVLTLNSDAFWMLRTEQAILSPVMEALN